MVAHRGFAYSRTIEDTFLSCCVSCAYLLAISHTRQEILKMIHRINEGEKIQALIFQDSAQCEVSLIITPDSA